MLTTEGTVDPTGHRCLSGLIESGICQSAVYLQATESTNAVALRDIVAGLPQTFLPRVYLTDQQTAGRGRHGRRWHSNDHTITFSIVIGRDALDLAVVRFKLWPLFAGLGVEQSDCV